MGPEWTAFGGIAERFKTVRFDVDSHIVDAHGERDSVLRIFYRKPHFARCEVHAGDGAGGVAIWRGGPDVLVRPPGILSRFSLALARDDSHVVDSRGRGCGQVTLENFAADFAAGGTLAEIAGPAVDGAPTDTVVWTATAPNAGGDTKRDLFISKTTHLPVELRAYHGSVLVEDSHYRDIEVDPPLPYDTFEL